MSPNTLQTEYKVSLLAMLVLLLTLVQGTSTSLTLAYKLKPSLEPTLSALWGLTYLMSLVGLSNQFGINWITWLIRYRLLLTVLLMGTAFSSMWSIETSLTMERSVHLIGSTLIAFYIGFTIPLTRIVSITTTVLGLLMFASIVTVFAVPAIGIESYEGNSVWRGIMTSKNTLGFWATITILCSATAMGNVASIEKKLLCLAALLGGLTALIFSVSATSLLALIVGGSSMLYLYLAFRFKLGLIATFILGIMFATIVAFAFYNIDTAELIGRSGDLTGRSEVWSQTWGLIKARPLTGYGYGTIWFPTPDSLWIQQSLTDFSWKVYHAHNGLLQLASEIGIPLTALAIVMIVQQLIEIVYCQYQRQQAGALFVLGFTVALLVSNYSEARLMINRELYWIFFVALPISMLQQVTMNSTGTNFYPMPATLHKRTRRKKGTQTSDRKRRRAIKQRLNERYSMQSTEDGQVIDGEKTNLSAEEKIQLNIKQNTTDSKRPTRLNRRQKKTGP